MKAREPDADGYVETGGIKIHYEVHGDGPGGDRPTLLLLPTWTIVHKEFWKLQVPYLARHYRVLTYDGPGNGRSDRPLDPSDYDHDRQVEHALAVLDATGTDRAVLVGLSRAAYWALDLAANHEARVLGTILIGPSVRLGTGSTHRGPQRLADPATLPRPASRPSGPTRWSTGRSTTSTSGARRTTTSCGSSSGCASRSRVRPSPSRTAWAGAARPRPRCWWPSTGAPTRTPRRSGRGAPASGRRC